mmetsp:Transcript_88114/g.247805  ORF Transcript_88114/g.247805 Transcript_88114/m.247805 type:complete len:91 (-) Transcript_88114:83-355(-)
MAPRISPMVKPFKKLARSRQAHALHVPKALALQARPEASGVLPQRACCVSSGQVWEHDLVAKKATPWPRWTSAHHNLLTQQQAATARHGK